MKKNLLLTAVLIAVSFNAYAFTQATPPPAEIAAVLHSGESVLPAPPEIGSELWLNDSLLYKLYKEPALKNMEENWDSVWAVMNEQYYFALFRLGADTVMHVPFLTDVVWTKNAKTGKYSVTYNRNTTDFPEMNNLETLCEAMKTYHTELWRTRQRPYYYFNDWYKGKKYSRSTANASSYPSGHAYFKALFGKCLEIIDPENTEVIDNMMEEWLHCRLQLGAHWNTDLIAGRQLGEIAFDSAMTVDAFRNQVYAAKNELRAYRLAHSLPESGKPEACDIDADIETSIAGMQGSTTDITIHRILYKDGWFNTLCLPFSLTASEIASGPLAGCELFEFESATKNGEALELNIHPTENILAGHPYLIRWTSGDNILSMTFRNVLITASSGTAVGTGVQFVGTIGQSELTGGNENQLFLGVNNTLYWPDSDNSLKGFRAYFLVDGVVAPSHSPARLVIRPHTPTSIGTLETNGSTGKVMENGQLIILHKGTRYNAQGTIVK